MKKLHNPIKSLKASKFFDLVKERTHNFKMGSEKPIPTEYPVNALARKLHPDQQFVKIAKIQDHGMNCKTFTFVPDKEKGCQELAYFSSGQYITIFLKINNFNFSRPYSLSSAPKESLVQKTGRLLSNYSKSCSRWTCFKLYFGKLEGRR